MTHRPSGFSWADDDPSHPANRFRTRSREEHNVEVLYGALRFLARTTGKRRFCCADIEPEAWNLGMSKTALRRAFVRLRDSGHPDINDDPWSRYIELTDW